MRDYQLLVFLAILLGLLLTCFLQRDAGYVDGYQLGWAQAKASMPNLYPNTDLK